MDRIATWWRGHRPTTRRLAQLYAALLYNAHLKGFVDGTLYTGGAKALCVPGLNCYSCPGAVGACPLGALQNALASSGVRAGWYVLGILMLFGLTLGRTVCGWLCPMGLLQELVHKIPTPKLRKGRLTRALSWVKYGILAVFVVAMPLYYGLSNGLAVPAFCKYICPAGTLEGAVGLLSNPKNGDLLVLLGGLFTGKFVILLAVGLACLFCHRAFCRFLCPLGALYGCFNRLSLAGVRVDAAKCDGCGACVRCCPMDVRCAGDRECIQCGRCVPRCPRAAISLRAGRIPLVAPEAEKSSGKGRTILRILAAAALAFALVWFNALDPAVKSAPVPSIAEESDVPVGHEAGMRLADFSVACVDGTEFRLSDQRGKVVFINLWATYCAPCVKELSLFSDLNAAHAGDVAMLAAHSSLVTEDVAAYLADKDWALPFAVDEGDAVFDAVGGSSLLPQTVVLNRRGEVIYNQVGSVTAETLEELYQRAAE